MIDFFASVTVASIVVMTIVILISNFRQARILNQVRGVLEEWYQSHMRDRLEKHQTTIVINDPLEWFGNEAGVKITEVSRILDKPQALEFLTSQGTRLVVSHLSPQSLKRKIRTFRLFGKGKAARLVVPLLGNRFRKVGKIKKTRSEKEEWFLVNASAALRALDVDWGEIKELWFYLVPVETKRTTKRFSIDFSKVEVWVRLKKDMVQKWFKKYIFKSSS